MDKNHFLDIHMTNRRTFDIYIKELYRILFMKHHKVFAISSTRDVIVCWDMSKTLRQQSME